MVRLTWTEYVKNEKVLRRIIKCFRHIMRKESLENQTLKGRIKSKRIREKKQLTYLSK